MEWITVLAVVVSSVMVFLCTEQSVGLREGRLMSLLLLAAASILFLATAVVASRFPPANGAALWIAAALPSATGIACFWMVKNFVDARRPTAAFVGGLLGLGMVVLGIGIVLLGPAVAVANVPDDAQSRLAGFEARRSELEHRLMNAIPDFRRQLTRDAGEVKLESAKAQGSTKSRLTAELRDIARMLIAIDKEEHQTREMISRVKQEERRLERLIASKAVLGDDQTLLKELDKVWQDSAAQLSRPVDQRIGTGAIDELAVDQKLNDL